MILILSGPVRSGKTSFLGKLVRELRRQAVGFDGFLSVSVLKDGELIGYDLHDLNGDKASPYIRKEGAVAWEKVGPYFFIPEALEMAKQIILSHRKDNFLIVDEVGPLEIRGGGIWPALRVALSKPSLRCLLVVRSNVLREFRKLLGPAPLKIINVEDANAFGSFRQEILESAPAE